MCLSKITRIGNIVSGIAEFAALITRRKYQLSERHACRIVSQTRGTQRYIPTVRADEDALTRAIVTLASEYGRYGYRRITALLQISGWQVERSGAAGSSHRALTRISVRSL